jgi:lactate racemase
VILVGDDSEITSCMGLKRVDSVTEALGMAQYIQCRASPSAIYMHIPPLFMCEVS